MGVLVAQVEESATVTWPKADSGARHPTVSMLMFWLRGADSEGLGRAGTTTNTADYLAVCVLELVPQVRARYIAHMPNY